MQSAIVQQVHTAAVPIKLHQVKVQKTQAVLMCATVIVWALFRLTVTHLLSNVRVSLELVGLSVIVVSLAFGVFTRSHLESMDVLVSIHF